ncbi:MAG: ROK family protein [Patescibacteria group bacterium]
MKIYLGIDIGGTKTKAVLVSGSKVLKAVTFKTPKTKVRFLALLGVIINDFKKTSKIDGVGIGFPGMIDFSSGIVLRAPNLSFLNGWRALAFLKKFSRRVALGNDLQCLLLAEQKFGALKKKRNALVLGVGTGIGGAILIDGKAYRGKNGSAGEFGHMIIERNSTLEKLGTKSTPLTQKKRIEALGVGIANLINALDPEVVVLGGGAVIDGHVNVLKIASHARKHIISPAARKTKIVPTRLGVFAQAKGATLLF